MYVYKYIYTYIHAIYISIYIYIATTRELAQTSQHVVLLYLSALKQTTAIVCKMIISLVFRRAEVDHTKTPNSKGYICLINTASKYLLY